MVELLESRQAIFLVLEYCSGGSLSRYMQTHANPNLHVGAGLPEPMVHRAIAAGVTKFNVNTEVRAAARAATRRASADGGDVLDVMGASVDAMVPVIAEKIRLFGW